MSDVRPLSPLMLALIQKRAKHEHPCKWITQSDVLELLATIDAKDAENAELRKHIEMLREALSPLAQVIPPTWKRDVPLKAQSTDTFRYKLPLVRHYDEAVTALKATEPKEVKS